jgi:hypothetical protein
MVLIQKQTSRPMEQNKRLRNKTHSISHPIFDKGAKSHIGEKTAFSTNCDRKTGYLHVKTET